MAGPQLPLGQIQPQARPVDTFFTQGRPEPVAPARPIEIPSVPGIQTVGTGGTGGFQTQNGFAQLAQALAPFNKELIQLGSNLGQQYAQREFQEGLNESLRANRLLQGQIEQSAEVYAADNRRLAQTDQPAALLMDSMNPYRRGGIQTGLAQMAASDAMPTFMRSYQERRMELAALPAGSPEIVRFQSDVQQQVLQKYGLSESMPAVQKYFLSQANKAWEKVTELQWDDNQKLLKTQTPDLIVGEATALLRDAMGSDVVAGFDPATGQPLSYSLKNNPVQARQLLSLQVTAIFDKYAKRMGLPGEATQVVAEAWNRLFSTSLGEEAVAAGRGDFIDNSLMRQVLTGVEIGSPIKGGDGLTRRLLAGEIYGKTAVDDLLKYDSAKFERKERARQESIQTYESALAEATFGLEPGPELEAAMTALDQAQDANGNLIYGNVSAADKAKAKASLIPKLREVASFGMDPAAPQQLLNEIDSLPLRDFNPRQATEMLNRLLPEVPDSEKADFLKQGQALIRRKAEEKGKFDPLVKAGVDAAVVKEIAERFPTSILEMSKGGKTVDIYALRSNANANIRQAAFNVENGLMKHVQNRLLEKEVQNPAMTGPQKQAVIQAAIEEYTNSKYFQKLFPGIGDNPNADGTPSPAMQRSQQQSQQRPAYQGALYSSSQLRNLSDSDLRGFNQRPLLTPQTVRSEAENAANGRGFSAELRAAARRAGTTPLRMLEEQLKFNPGIPVPREMLNDIRRRERASAGTAAAVQQTAFNPITGAMQASANWLMNLVAPPAVAATMPRPTRGFVRSAAGGGGQWVSADRRARALIAMAQRNGWDPSDIAAIISYETGGTLNPAEPGRGAAAGRIGLIQAGPNERAAYGLGTGNWDREIQGIERYLKARGAKPGMGLADLYATVNGGNPRAGWSPDGNGVVPRSPSTLKALERHRQQALNRLGMRPPSGSLSSRRRQVSSITYDSGQPGIDVFFEDKRVPAVLTGRVKEINFQGGPGYGYGNFVVVESTDPATGRKVDVLYAHLPERPRLAIGSVVRAGQIIGRQGGTGRVRSADGTIASIDFLEPRPPGSKDMTPYRHFDRLRRRIAQQLGG
jgi:murein DD-endopeptidase MepM/ murein hydrolase activator NlpD